MDPLSLGVILLILAASGGIAFVADGLGKKIGKKRVSVFNLRPKHVASLGTVAMGVFVSGLTIGFIMAVSSDARAWLLQGRKILASNKRLQSDNKGLQAINKGFKAESRDLRAQNDAVRGENGRLAKANGKLQGDLKSLGSDLEHKRADLETLRGQQTALLADASRLNARVASLKEDVTSARRQYEATSAFLAKTKASLHLAQISLRTAQLDLRTARINAEASHKDAELAYRTSQDTFQKNQALLSTNNDLEEQVKKRQADVDKLKQDRDSVAKDLADAQQSYTLVKGDLVQATRELAQVQDMAESMGSFLQGGYRTSRTEAMIFRKGAELARVVVPAGADAGVAADALATLLREARIEAASRGAKPHKANGQNFEAADIMERKEPKTGEIFSADVLRRAIASQAAGRRQDQALVATSSFNAFTGEVVSLDVSMIPNPVVYRRNESVAEARIDGSQSEEHILAQLSDFYNGPLRDQAVHDRMIPRAGSASPFGGIPDADVLDLVQNVKRAGRSVRVQAVAKGDIRAADPLRLEFRVR